MTTGHWCDECREMYLPDPKKPHRSFEQGMKRLEEMKKTAKPATDMDAAVEIFAHIPPAPKVQAENDEFDF